MPVSLRSVIEVCSMRFHTRWRFSPWGTERRYRLRALRHACQAWKIQSKRKIVSQFADGADRSRGSLSVFSICMLNSSPRSFRPIPCLNKLSSRITRAKYSCVGFFQSRAMRMTSKARAEQTPNVRSIRTYFRWPCFQAAVRISVVDSIISKQSVFGFSCAW